jgi:hypothetical protein
VSKSSRNPTKLRYAVCFLLCLAASLQSRGGSGACDDTYSMAIRLMRALYPDVKAKGANVDIEAKYPFDADGPLLAFYIRMSASDQIACCVDSRSPNPSSAERVGQLSAHFQFDGRDYRISSFVASGSLVNDAKQEAIAKLVDEHPEWTDPDLTVALRRAGAKFGPDQKEELLARFPVHELEPILGKIEMGPAQFAFRGNSQAPHYALMNWSIRFQATSGTKQDQYAVFLEPFDGRVVALSRRSPD